MKNISTLVVISNVAFLRAFQFTLPSRGISFHHKSYTTKLAYSSKDHSNESNVRHTSYGSSFTLKNKLRSIQKEISTIALTAAITTATVTATVANANDFIDLDASSSLPTGEDTVKLVLQDLKDSTGDASKSFKVFETVNDIITEGKGVGGSLNYRKFIVRCCNPCCRFRLKIV